MERRAVSARGWAEKAQLGKDTVSRAIRPDYQHVTSTTTLAKLADALGEQPPGVAGAFPSVESLAEIVDVLQVAILGEDRKLDRTATVMFAEALRDTLLSLADEPESARDPRISIALARASIRQRRTQPAR